MFRLDIIFDIDIGILSDMLIAQHDKSQVINLLLNNDATDTLLLFI